MSYVNNMSCINNMSCYVRRSNESYELCKSYEYFHESHKSTCLLFLKDLKLFLLIYKDGKRQL